MKTLSVLAILSLLSAPLLFAQDTPASPETEPTVPAETAPSAPAPEAATEIETPTATEPTPAPAPEAPAPAPEPAAPALTQQAERAVEQAQQAITEFAESLDRNVQVQEFSAGLLKPIYSLAEQMESSWFYWGAFALMATGVVSYALQLILGKLVVLTRRGFSVTEILSDLVGLAISLVGLVLTTQAATQNSEFTRSAFSVLSAAAVGLLCGIILYLWGQAQEVAAAKGRHAKK